MELNIDPTGPMTRVRMALGPLSSLPPFRLEFNWLEMFVLSRPHPTPQAALELYARGLVARRDVQPRRRRAAQRPELEQASGRRATHSGVSLQKVDGALSVSNIVLGASRHSR